MKNITTKALAISMILSSFIFSSCSTTSEEKLQIVPTATESKIPSLSKSLAIDTEASKPANKSQLADLFQEYFDEGLELNPISGTFLGRREFNSRMVNMLSPEYREQSHAYNTRWLNTMQAVDRSKLGNSEQVSLDVLIYQLQQSLEGEQFPGHLIPISQFFSMPNFIAQLGSGKSVQPFQNVEDYSNWLLRVELIPVIFDQAIENMREGIAANITQPRVLMEKVLPQLSAHLLDKIEDSLFWQPIVNMPGTIDAEDAEHIRIEYKEMISAQIIPAYKRLHDFIGDEYIPASRTSIAWTELPNGDAWYNFRIRTQTTTKLTADEIHQFGLSEVARISAAMEGVKETVGFDGDLSEFLDFLQNDDQFYFASEEPLLQGYRDLQATINKQLPALFDISPRADYEVRAVEPFRAASSAGASYMASSPDGSRPGIFYVNTHNLRAQPEFIMETLSIHEASPGHHFQIAIQQEIFDLPMFRRFGGFTVFSEGWALYAESLGKELGMFTDPYQYYGRLSDEMLRAMRLVVDTGMHSKGWSRERAIQYMLDHSSMAESDVVAEVERYIAIPAQALSYKVGQRIISEARTKATAELGDKFDIRAFHRLVLTGGAVPMDVLQAQIDTWITAQH